MTDDHISRNRRIQYNEDIFDDAINGIVTVGLVAFMAWGSYKLIKTQYEQAMTKTNARMEVESKLASD